MYYITQFPYSLHSIQKLGVTELNTEIPCVTYNSNKLRIPFTNTVDDYIILTNIYSYLFCLWLTIFREIQTQRNVYEHKSTSLLNV